MSAISSILSAGSLNAPSATAAAAAKAPQTVDFLKLLMAQMKNQNPMDPQSGTDFMSQIAQFSQLDGINKLNSNFSDLIAMQSLTQGASLIGKTVTYASTANGTPTKGVVSSVAATNGKIQLMIGGVAVDLSQVRTIEPGPAPKPS
jgi:flagellar basal-body rod modification protein FlgD